jgi:hypothetical protein
MTDARELTTTEIDLDTLWLDVFAFTAKDWSELEKLSDWLSQSGHFNGDKKKCAILATAVWVELGNGIREADH